MTSTFASLTSRGLRGLAVLLLSALALAGCDDNPVGRICDLGVTPDPTEAVVASPSLDCVSRTCLRVPQEVAELPDGSLALTGNLGLCTAECSSDDDCDKVPESPCQTGFTCGVPVTVGPFCCKKLCICKDYLVVPPGDLAEGACNPDDNNNACCNLSGRAGNPAYPTCAAL
jgi:hypothetical protein